MSESLPLQGEDIARRPARGLLGWMNDQEGAHMLLGRALNPGEDRTKVDELLSSYRSAVQARSPFTSVDPIVETMTDDTIQAIMARTEIHAAFAGLDWRPALVDLRHVRAFQKVVNMDGLDERLAPVHDDLSSLLEFCIPHDQPQAPHGAIADFDQKGFTISSLNPNLRIAGGQLQQADVSLSPGMPAMKMQSIALYVHMGTSYLQVVHYNGRWFVRDGYHRAAGLLRKRICVVPCILILARSFEEVGTQSGALPYETLFGPHPPSLSDFWDDTVARTVSIPAIRKVIRVRGEEFAVTV